MGNPSRAEPLSGRRSIACRGNLVEAPVFTLEDGGFAGGRLPAAHRDVDLLRADLHGKHAAPDLLASHDLRARATERLVAQAGVVEIDEAKPRNFFSVNFTKRLASESAELPFQVDVHLA